MPVRSGLGQQSRELWLLSATYSFNSPPSSARGHLLVAFRLVRDLLLFAKHLLFEARACGVS
jgi:hypothetical protein